MQILRNAEVAETAATIRTLTAEVASLDWENEELRESFADLQLALEDRGWLSLSIQAASQFTRDGLGRAAQLCRILAVSNPLVKRGLALRNAYVWGTGLEITPRDPGVGEVIALFDDANQASFTGSQAREELERALGTDGNVFLALFTSPLTGRVKVRSFPFDEIAEVVSNPDDRDEPWYYLRRWIAVEISPTGQRSTIQYEAFYPALGYRPASRPKMIDDVEVIWDAPLLHVSVNRLDGWDFGLGDAYAAMPWARAYAEFLSDWSRLMKSLARFAWRVTGDKKSKAQTAATKIRESLPAPTVNTNGTGATAVMAGSTLEAIPKSGATIDAESGRPLAGMVAAALGVPVTMLLADPGQTGARAVAETLDRPTRLEMESRRAVWATALSRVYDHVIDQAVKAPRGPLAGNVGRDEDGSEVITLADEADRSIDIVFPKLDEVDPVQWISAIVSADGTQKVPPLVIARLILLALGVDDVDEVLDTMTDSEGNWIDPDVTAGDAAIKRFRDGEEPDL